MRKKEINFFMLTILIMTLFTTTIFAHSGIITVHVPSWGRWSSRTHGVKKQDNLYGVVYVISKTQALSNLVQFYSYARDERISMGNYTLNHNNYEYGEADANRTAMDYRGKNSDWNGHLVHVRLRSHLMEPNLGYIEIRFTP